MAGATQQALQGVADVRVRLTARLGRVRPELPMLKSFH